MQDRFIASITQLPVLLRQELAPLLNKDFAGHLDGQQLRQLKLKTGMSQTQLLQSLLPIAVAFSHAPISQFPVGAIAMGKSGDIYMGGNIEFSLEALFHSVHAEQSAISHAWLSGESQIVSITVNASPCGHCRQFINEMVAAQQVLISIPGQEIQPLSYYLPQPFGPKDLKITRPFLAKQQIELSMTSSDPMISDPMLIEGLDHAGLSYAPYSETYAAVVLETHEGATYCGRYAENAAFNPSMLPMQMALSTLIRHNRPFSEIKRALLIESSKGKLSLAGVSMDALRGVSSTQLEHIMVEPV